MQNREQIILLLLIIAWEKKNWFSKEFIYLFILKQHFKPLLSMDNQRQEE